MPLTMTSPLSPGNTSRLPRRQLRIAWPAGPTGALLDPQKSSKLERAMFLTFCNSQTDRGEWPLPVDLGHRVAQGFVGESHEAAIGLAQLEDNENRARDRERPHEIDPQAART